MVRALTPAATSADTGSSTVPRLVAVLDSRQARARHTRRTASAVRGNRARAAHPRRQLDAPADAHARTTYLRQLWTWLQAQPDYRGRTHLLITVDHGRGHTPKDWRDHGAKVPGSDGVWIAFASPRMAQRGLWRHHAPLSTSQIAATVASWMGVDWNATHPDVGAPIR